MTIPTEINWEEIQTRMAQLLPARYLHCQQSVRMQSMGSAPLHWNAFGEVDWDRMWTSFCDLALAGGPPHRGKWLPAVATPIEDFQQESYQIVANELCRAIQMVTPLTAQVSQVAGCIEIPCTSSGMANWLQRAIVAENVAATVDGLLLRLPAGPYYRIEKEIKNVVTAIAKTFHYWMDHVPEGAQHLSSDVWEPQIINHFDISSVCLQLQPILVPDLYPDWWGIQFADVEQTVHYLRIFAVLDVLVRREEKTLFLPKRQNLLEMQQMLHVVDRAIN